MAVQICGGRRKERRDLMYCKAELDNTPAVKEITIYFLSAYYWPIKSVHIASPANKFRHSVNDFMSVETKGL
jgi:hypothetical protein